ncbi:DUF1684 domain-containing protein [Flavobacterium antarcticum]|uniref:DUF1684 domain-containing protein n=1 Tax=Flavobacterium antarcticum TaxID=271155 RepID=UPI0003B535AB|nr:DUF1684 domain-containing protein [Flavobacterium antarcticum]
MQKILVSLFIFTSLLSFGQQKVTAEAFQKKLNEEFADATKSPLTDEDRLEFKALDFFPIDANFIVEAKFEKAKNEKAFAMKTSTERTPMYVKYGVISFTLNGENFKLNVYQNLELMKRPGFKNHLFLPFSDLTSGNETYIGGRYIDLEIPKAKTIIIDFNQAYNPYCAYNYRYSCPIVPLENDLATKINAGVKKFHD